MNESLTERLLQLRRFYQSGATRSYHFRKEQLQKLRSAILEYEQALHDALYADLKKSAEESWITETGFLLSEIRFALKNLYRWMQPVRTGTNLVNFPSSSFVLREPLGVTLIIAPWNYPLMLLLNPLIGAIAAGNCAVLKPSEFSPATTRVMAQLIKETFPEDYILFAEGDGAEVIPAMMENFRFDHVFYTGSTATGRHIYKMAADKLVPVTLELGGKSPVIVESDANVKVAARRIAVTKFSNTGQMCLAPDYVLVHQSRKEELLRALKACIHDFYSDDPAASYDFGKIVNEKQFHRLARYLEQGNIVHGGRYDISKLYIEPTVMADVPADAPVMKEEIFGPVLPVIGFDTMDEALAIIQNNPDPLALYLYTVSRKKEKAWLEAVSFGGGCVNNSSWHFTNPHLPFGGRGFSGLGQYHGRDSFEVFSHRKSIMKTPTWFDPSLRYPPLKGKLKWFKWIVR